MRNERATVSISPELRAAALVSKAWPYEEARKLLKRYPDGPGDKAIVFETGYGPSGLPHIGTFNEVLRTTMVRHALHATERRADPADRLFATTWTGCARCRTMCRNQADAAPNISASR